MSLRFRIAWDDFEAELASEPFDQFRIEKRENIALDRPEHPRGF